jgi:hypothetical protein
MSSTEHQVPDTTSTAPEQESAAALAGEGSTVTAAPGEPTEPHACEQPGAPVSEAPTSEKSAAEPTNSVAEPIREERQAGASGGASSAPALQGQEGAVAVQGPVGLPKGTLNKLFPEARTAMQIIARRPPTIAGQSAADYYELLGLIVDEWKPATYEECSLVKQIADKEWDVLTSQELTTGLFNGAIAESLVARIVDVEVETGGNKEQEDRSVQPDTGRQVATHQNLQTIRRIVFAAVAGDKAAIDLLERHLGPEVVGMGPHIAGAFKANLPAHIYADRRTNAALAQRDAAIRQLLKLAEERRKRIASKKMTAADVKATLSLTEYFKLSTEIHLASDPKPAVPDQNPNRRDRRDGLTTIV